MTCSAPERELVTFWAVGTLAAAETAAVSLHLVTCGECRAEAAAARDLVRGLRELHLRSDEVVAAAAGDIDAPHLEACGRCQAEVDLLRRVNTDLATRTRGVRLWPWLSGLAAAAMVVVAVQVARQGGPGPIAPAPMPSPAVAPGDPPARPAGTPATRVPVVKAPITLSNADVVVLRGNASPRQRFLEELAAALEPYQRDDFADAETRLRGLLRARADLPEVNYYLGVCLLMLDRPADAVEPLRQAARGRDPSTASYYLAVAQVNAGDVKAGVAALRGLCGRRTASAEAACAALRFAPGGHD